MTRTVPTILKMINVKTENRGKVIVDLYLWAVYSLQENGVKIKLFDLPKTYANGLVIDKIPIQTSFFFENHGKMAEIFDEQGKFIDDKLKELLNQT